MFYNRSMKWTFRLILAICLVIAIRDWGVALTTLSERELYVAANTAGPWTLRVGLNLLWGCLFAALIWGLWRRQSWAYHTWWWAVAVHTFFVWAWLAAFAQTEFDQGRLGFVAATSTLGVGFAFWLKLRLRAVAGEFLND